MTPNSDIDQIYSYFQSQNIKIDKEEFKFQVKTHADYPSLLAFSDALSFFNILNKAIKLPFDNLESLEDSFIALLQNDNDSQTLFHLTKEKDFYLIKENKKILKLTKEELKRQWQGIVLITEPQEDYIENNSSKSNNIALTVIIITFTTIFLLLVNYFTVSLYYTLFCILPIIGLFLSIEALKTELGIESKISQSFCNIIPNADCEQVINSNKNKLIQNIKISDISFWFFASQLITIFVFSVAKLNTEFLSIMIFGLALSIPMTFYSIYFQYKVEKKWCPICLSIISIIYLEFSFLLFLNKGFQVSISNFIIFVTLFSFIAILIYLIKPIFLEKKVMNEKYIDQLRFSRNYDIFKNSLLKSETQFFDREYIVLGNRESTHKISLVTSPLCKYCKDAHNLLDSVHNRFRENICISIRFNYYEKSTNKNLFLRLAEIYETKGDSAFIFALRDWFENKNLEKWLNKFGDFENTFGVQEKLMRITNENEEKGLNFTPNIFLNQYNYPNQYERENLEYFVADWLEDKVL